MRKSPLYMATLCLLSGCGTTRIYEATPHPEFSAEVAKFLQAAQTAIVAYQDQDKAAWDKLVCQSPKKHPIESVQRFVGKYEDIRLVAVKDHWSAANKPPHQEFIEVVFEGKASNYPMSDHRMALTFTYIGDNCLYLSF